MKYGAKGTMALKSVESQKCEVQIQLGMMMREMFKPNFRYTDKIVGSLTQIAAARELVLNSPFVPKWEVSLRREAIIRSAHSSTDRKSTI